MSARRRRDRGDAGLFETSSVPTLQDTDASIFGSIDRVDSGRVVAKPISIFEIAPDPLQPRRAVPSPVRAYWDGRAATTAALVSSWFHLAIEERGEEFRVEPYLIALDEVPRPENPGPIESSFLSLIELAANIRANGLTNPITVVLTPQGYRLETGERRWLAYHILYIFFENEQDTWARIPARVVAEASVWRQASENNARANLNAVGKARQLAILLMDLYRQQGMKFLAVEQLVQPGGSERAYYAQVADGERYPIPKGYGEALMNAMGFKQASQMREHRSLLRLPDEVWRLADDLNWPYGRIRALERRSVYDHKQMIRLALEQASAEGYRVGIPTPEAAPLPAEPLKEYESPLYSRENRRRFQRLWRLAGRVVQGNAQVSRRELDEIRYMREWLDELEQAARGQLKK